jgi:hypothetical protein
MVPVWDYLEPKEDDDLHKMMVENGPSRPDGWRTSQWCILFSSAGVPTIASFDYACAIDLEY